MRVVHAALYLAKQCSNPATATKILHANQDVTSRPKGWLSAFQNPVEAPWKPSVQSHHCGRRDTRKKISFRPYGPQLSILRPRPAFPMSARAMTVVSQRQVGMSDSVTMWVIGQVLAIGSFFATCAALFYAHLAYRSSTRNTEQAQAAELTSLRIQAKAGLDDAQRSLFALKANCQANRADWRTHEFRQGPALGRMEPMFRTTPTDKVQHRGQAILEKLGSRLR